MDKQDFEYMIGQTYQLKPHIVSRPDYFNDMGDMDKYMNGTTFVVKDIVKASVGWCVEIRDSRNEHDYWVIKIDDIVPVELDNRKVRQNV